MLSGGPGQLRTSAATYVGVFVQRVRDCLCVAVSPDWLVADKSRYIARQFGDVPRVCIPGVVWGPDMDRHFLSVRPMNHTIAAVVSKRGVILSFYQ